VSKIEANTSVILVLHSPREKVWGVLEEITGAGVFMRGLDLNAFEDYIGAIIREEDFIGLSDQFFPLWRVERIVRDETAGGVLSLAEQFEERTGKKISDF
jgi:hypothetical protein